MNPLVHLSWKQRLSIIILIAILGLLVVSGAAFLGLKNVNDSIKKRNAFNDYQKLSISLAYQALRLQSWAVGLTKGEVDDYAKNLSVLPDITESMVEMSAKLDYEEFKHWANQLNQLAQRYTEQRQQWLEVKSELGYSATEGVLEAFDQGLINLEKIAFSMIEEEVGGIVRGQRSYIINKTDKFEKNIDESLVLLEKRVVEWEWEENKVGEAVMAYRDVFTLARNLIAKESAIETELEPIVEELNNLISMQREFEDSVVKEVISAADHSRKLAVRIIFIASMIVGVVIFLSLGGIARQLYTQLGQMQDFLKQLAQGDFSKRLTLNGNKRDEFTQLRSANNHMVHDVSGVIAQVVQGNHSLLSVRDELEAAVEKLTKNSIEIEQNTQQSTIATQQISIAVNDVAKRSVQVSETSQSAFDSTKEGGKVINDCVHSMVNIVELIEKTHEEVSNLGQSSTKMLGIIDVINGLADQTNLLALNAAIESARAGEAGRGFSVVADEVRTLAQKTVGATSNIGEIINNFNEQSNRMEALMEEGIKLASSGQENANNAMSSFEKIEDNIKNVASEMDQVVVAVEEISYNTNDIATQVEHICQQTEGAKDIRLTLERHTHSLSEQADTLGKLTGRFKLTYD